MMASTRHHSRQSRVDRMVLLLREAVLGLYKVMAKMTPCLLPLPLLRRGFSL
jgi:hypothetical protein